MKKLLAWSELIWVFIAITSKYIFTLCTCKIYYARKSVLVEIFLYEKLFVSVVVVHWHDMLQFNAGKNNRR